MCRKTLKLTDFQTKWTIVPSDYCGSLCVDDQTAATVLLLLMMMIMKMLVML